jgi:O-antigen/teichoic acid export membrane protein
MSSKTIALLHRFPRAVYAVGEASNALNLLLLAVLARFLGVEAYGDLMAIMAGAGILGEVVEFGFPRLVARTLVRRPGESWPLLREAMARQLELCLPILVLLYAYIQLANISPSAEWAGFLIGISFCCRSLKATLRGACLGLKLFTMEALFLWTERGSLLLCGVLALYFGGGLLTLGLVFFFVRSLDLVMFLWALRSSLPTPVASLPTRASIGFRAAYPFAAAGFLWGMYYQVDTAMLSILSTPYDTGIYGSLYRFVDILAVVPRVIIVVAFPGMAAAWIADRNDFSKTVEVLQRALLSIAIPIFFMLIVWSEGVLSLVYGEEYAAGAAALRLVLVGVYFSFHSMLLTQSLSSSTYERKVAVALTVAVFGNIALNLVLIPREGFMGAAIATMATEFMYFVTLCSVALISGTLKKSLTDILILAGGALMLLTAVEAEHLTMPWMMLLFFLAWGTVIWRVRPDRLVFSQSV